MSDVHYFPRYAQQENFVTNNTLLLLLRLREYDHFKFEKFMEMLCAEQDVELASSWFRFQQQKTTGKGIVDGFIAQDSIKIAIETKLGDTFDSAQLERHLNVFKEEQHKLLILLSPTELSAQQLASVRERATQQSVQVLHASFADVVGKARECLSMHDEEMQALVSDYEAFCSEVGLLPRDEYMLLIPPCGQSFRDNQELRLYYCPATRTLRKTRYLGVYKGKRVRAIGRIAKVVAVEVNLDADSVRLVDEGERLGTEEARRILEATRRAPSHGWDITTGHKFYLCDAMEETDFPKRTGWIWNTRHIDLETVLEAKIPADLGELARQLRGRSWD